MNQDVTNDLKEGLLKRLKGGNKRYPHLNATIGRSVSKLDLRSLDTLKKGLTSELVKKLLTDVNFKYTLPLKDIDQAILKYTNTKKGPKKDEVDEEFENLRILREIKKKIGFLEAYQREEISEFGTRSFALGYPLLAKQLKADKEDVICAPLFLWYLDIKRDYQNNSIIITRNEDNPIVFNEMLDYHLETELALDFSDVTREFTEEIFNDGIMNEDEINSCIKKITDKISSSLSFNLNTSMMATPSNRSEVAKILEQSNSTESILNAGLFGVFRAGKQSIIDDLKHLILDGETGPIEEEEVLRTGGIPYVAVETDPTQNGVITGLGQSNNLIIQGPPGTGKSQTLTAVITNALTNGQRTLVVCEKRTAMEIIASNLSTYNLSQYVALIENVNKDRTAIVDKARAVYESRNQPHYKVTSELNNAMESYGVASLQVAKHHASIAETETKGLGQNKDILGLYLRHINEIDIDKYLQIKRLVNKTKFNLTNSEFTLVIENLTNTDSQYIEFDELAHLPKQIVTDRNNYTDDKKNLASSINKVKSDLQSLGKKAGGYHERLVREFIARTSLKHEEIIRCSRTARQYIGINRVDFEWLKVSNHIESIVLTGSSKQKAKECIGKINKIESQIAQAQSALQARVDEILSVEKELRDWSDRVVEHIKILRDLQVNNFNLDPTDSIKAIFGSKQKKIKISKQEVSRGVKGINMGLQKLSGVMDTIPLTIDSNPDKELRAIMKALPTKAKIYSYFQSQTLQFFLELDSAERVADWTLEKYIETLAIDQFDNYKLLEAPLWKFYKAEIESHLTAYLRDHFGLLIDNSLTPESILDSLIEDSLAAAELHSEAMITVDGLLPQKISGVNEIKTSAKTILSEGKLADVHKTHLERITRSATFKDILDSINTNIDDLPLLLDKIDSLFFAYHSWCTVYCGLDPVTQHVIDVFERVGADKKEWVALFRALYMELAFTDSCSSLNLKNEIPITQMFQGDQKIKKLIVDNIHAVWSAERLVRIGSLESGILKFNSLYNKRGGPGQRRNPLRKILDKDLKLFTSIFPVLICNPSSVANLLKLEKNLFDVVLFDEASQLRLEDVYTSLYRGRTKIISGDKHQMPPSNYFQGVGGEDEGDYEDDESLQNQGLINSESLLDYGQMNNYHSEMLRVHYRSAHQDLINFSNYAFYGGRLLPVTSLQDYVAIEYSNLAGIYTGRTNVKEANFIIKWLEQFLQEGVLDKSVGIVTLNLPQSELIKEKISEKRTEDSEFNAGISRLEELGFFVKNLENIQGDERDIMVLSTTFGQDADGKFAQRFGPLTQKNGYRLLNVLVTRAKDKFVVVTSVPDKNIAMYQDEIAVNGNDRKGIFYAYLAYARSISAGNKDETRRILELLSEHGSEAGGSELYEGNTESPFEEEVLEKIESVIPRERIVLQYPVGSEKFRIDIVILDHSKTRPMLAVECDGYTYHSSPDAHLYDIYRQKILEGKGFKFYRIWSTNWFHDEENESQKLIRTLQELDALER